ncbi:DUF6541 family protein [Pseudarthrobacter sp. J47]|uniref:DUF6541 family protein n=1 Tax=Pseudarthrobacter sp. J47 TaxID=3116482 RepID=UPI002E8226DD|nr:DUF6541 family protein [Pseudarthrobacter sp. J47]
MTVSVFMVPGVIFGWAAGARRYTLVMLAPAFSVSIAGMVSLLGPFVGLPWNIWTVAGATVLFSVIALVVRRLLSRSFAEPGPAQSPRWLGLATAVAFAIAAALVTYRLIYAFKVPESISQTYDNVFHLNAIRWALDSANASPLNLGHFTGISMYPSGWHAMVSLVVGITGAAIPVGVNVVNIVIGAVVWPLSCIYFAQVIAGRRIVPTVIAAILSAGFSAFPMLMVDWGVLYPNLLSISLLPAALAVCIGALGLGRLREFSQPIHWLIALTVVPGMALAHPSTLMGMLAFLMPAVFFLYAKRVKSLRATNTLESRRASRRLTALLMAGLAAFAAAWYVIRPPESAAGWLAVQSSAQAVGEIIMSAPMGRPAAGLTAVLLVTGIVLMVKRRSNLWLLGMFVVGAFLYFYVSGMSGRPRGLITGIWYYDPNRLAALMPVVTLGPAVLGGTWLFERARRAYGDWKAKDVAESTPLRRLDAKGFLAPVLAVGLSLFFIWGTQFASVGTAAYQASLRYTLDDKSVLLSEDEMELLSRLPSEVPEDAVIAGMPSNGSALAYALAGRKVLQPHILTTHGPETDVINRWLKFAKEQDEEVCEAVRTENVRYVLDFGSASVTGFLAGYNGVRNIGDASGMTLVDSEGAHAKLYRVNACW